jgi:hypothetical protein
VLLTPARPASLLSLVALLSAPALAVNFLLKPSEPVQIRLAPKPHGPAIAYAQPGAFYLAHCKPPLQRHGRDTHGTSGLLCVKGLCHTVIYVTHLGWLVKLFVLVAALPQKRPFKSGKPACLLLGVAVGNGSGPRVCRTHLGWRPVSEWATIRQVPSSGDCRRILLAELR